MGKWVSKYAFAVFAMMAAALGLPSLCFGFVGETTDTTDLNAALKIIFDRALVNNVIYDSELISEFQEGGGIQQEQTTGGRYIETAHMFDLPAGVGARGENDYIPVPAGPTIVNGRVSLKKILGAVEMTGDVMKRVRSDEGAFVAWAERALPSLVERLTNELDRMLLGYGTGAKARVNAATPATTLVVDSAYGLELPAGTPLTDPLFQFLAGESLIASPNPDGSTPRGAPDAMKVTKVDFAAASPTITVDALATGLANNDYLFAGDIAGNSADKEPMGLLGMVDDGSVLATFQNITRATYPAWNSFVQDCQGSPFASGQKLTEQVIMYADDTSFVRGNAKIMLFVCSRQGARHFWNDLVADRAINDKTAYTGGKEALFMVLGDRVVRLKVARKMPSSLAFGLTPSTFKRYMLHEWEWQDLTGSIWHQVTDSTGRKDAFWAYGAMYAEFSCSAPHKNFRIENITDAAF